MADGDWIEAFTLAVRSRNRQAVNGLAMNRHTRVGDAGSFMTSCLYELLRYGRADVIEWLREEIGDEDALRGPILFAAGLARAVDLDLDAATMLLRRGAYHSVVAAESVFSADTLFASTLVPTMIQQASMCEPAEFDAGDDPPSFPDIAIGPAPEGWGRAGWLVLAACDADYFLAYAERFLVSLQASAPGAPALIHIINPTDASRALARRLGAEHRAAGFCSQIGPASTTYYACGRLIIARRLLERLRRPLIITDIDTVFPAEFPDLAERCGGHDVVVERNPARLHPSMQVSAAFLALRPGDRADAFLRPLETYLARKFQEPHLWMLDQGALFRAVCLAHGAGRPVATVSSLGLPTALVFPDCLVGPHILDETTRRGRRSLGRSVGLSFDPVTFKPTCLYAEAPKAPAD